ncbi:MAG TPA: PQQ-binding-like beta-propeller repeat protein, partial [Solirubrobacteraceae bacterium]
MLTWLFRTKRGLISLGVAVLVLAGGALAAYLIVRKPGDVSHPDLSFTETTPKAPPPKKPKAPNFRWPYYGYDAARTKVLPDSNKIRPPFHQIWAYRQKALLEFPPSIDNGRLFVLQNDGFVVALRAKDGRKMWMHRLGKLAAASPAVGRHRVWVVVLRKGDADFGRVACLRQSNGKIIWSRDLPSRAESSPLLLHGRIYFGSENGTVYALNARTGHQVWTYHAAGAVKAGLAYDRGTLYFGDYAGEVYALKASNGGVVWKSGSSGGYAGGSGQFYSTPAAAYGRVYVGNTDGRMYSFAAGSGHLAWATRTSAYFYASPSVATIPGLGPTVYGGSYDGNFYAFDARSGAVRWHYPASGRISGGAQIVGGLVYFSDLGDRKVIALSPKTGKVRYTFPDGAFNPVVADRNHLYVIGFGNIYAMAPGQAKPKHQHQGKQK